MYDKKLKKIFGNYNPTILYTIIVLLAAISLTGILIPNKLAIITSNLTDFIVSNFGWWLSLSIVFFIGFIITLAFSKYGNIKLGKDDDKPEYSFFTWFSLLFSCGLGIALYFWGVAEPITHYMMPPYLENPETIQSASLALQITNMHYGITMWSVFSTVGVIIAYFAFRKNKPLTVSTGLYGLLGDGAYGRVGNIIDFLTIFATVGGVATSVGMGIMQLKYGITWITGFSVSDFTMAIIFLIFMIGYTITATKGVKGGMKNLSTFNIYLALGIMGFVFIFGPTKFNIELMIQSTGEAISNLPKMLLFLDPGKVTEGWTKSWSIFYWCWHMSWAPFVGGFVASISRGRTIREFIIGVLGVPIIFTIIWFGIFGGSSIFYQYNGVDIFSAINVDISAGIFKLFEQLPLSKLLGILMFINLLTFLATSANSASLYTAVIASKGSEKPKTPMIILWSLIIGLIGIILMFSGGLEALQSAAVASGSIFSIIIILMIVSMIKSLKEEDL